MKGAKQWFKSKTVWVNIVGVLVIVLQVLLKTDFIVDADYQALLLALLNILLRFKTSKAIKL